MPAAIEGNMRAVVSTSRAVRSAERAVVGTNLRVVMSIPLAVAPSMPPPKTPPCRSDSDLTMAPDLAQVLDVVRAVHVQPWQVLVQPWQLGASLDDREGVEFDADRLGAWRPLDAACAAQDARCGGERSKEGLLVLCFGVLDKGCPVDLTQAACACRTSIQSRPRSCVPNNGATLLPMGGVCSWF